MAATCFLLHDCGVCFAGGSESAKGPRRASTRTRICIKAPTAPLLTSMFSPVPLSEVHIIRVVWGYQRLAASVTVNTEDDRRHNEKLDCWTWGGWQISALHAGC
jgi:hypothetical protein